MNDILYRHRRWKKFQHAEKFIKDNINTFQGLNKDEQKNYPNRALGQARYNYLKPCKPILDEWVIFIYLRCFTLW